MALKGLKPERIDRHVVSLSTCCVERGAVAFTGVNPDRPLFWAKLLVVDAALASTPIEAASDAFIDSPFRCR